MVRVRLPMDALDSEMGGNSPRHGCQQGGGREGLARGSSARVDADLQAGPSKLGWQHPPLTPNHTEACA